MAEMGSLLKKWESERLGLKKEGIDGFKLREGSKTSIIKKGVKPSLSNSLSRLRSRISG